MHSRVRLQLVLQAEFLGAAATLVRLLSRVAALVILQGAVVTETAATELALEPCFSFRERERERKKFGCQIHDIQIVRLETAPNTQKHVIINDTDAVVETFRALCR